MPFVYFAVGQVSAYVSVLVVAWAYSRVSGQRVPFFHNAVGSVRDQALPFVMRTDEEEAKAENFNHQYDKPVYDVVEGLGR